MPPPPIPRKRNRSASPSSPSGDSEYDPVTKPRKGGTAPKATPGHKLGPNGRPLSREQLRRANHSLIERRRREKINAALSNLRGMVPGLGEDNGGKGGEFKLEVLERTVEHMRELKNRIADLEAETEVEAAPDHNRRRLSTTTDDSSMDVDSPREREVVYERERGHGRRERPYRPWYSSPKHPSSPPSPSMTPPVRAAPNHDPDETEEETNLPAPFTLAFRSRSDGSHSSQTRTSTSHSTASPHPPSISSLLSSAPPPRSQHQSRAPPPDICLPFPTPSPTSPFHSYPSNASTASSATGPPEPSPFLAPLQNISLFDGAFPSPLTGPHKLSPPERVGEMNPEDAAHMLLAISSPDTLRPTHSSGSTPLMTVHRGLERRLPLDAEEFTLDGGIARSGDVNEVRHHHRTQGKTARDILRM
ncbi:hypothetical protein CcaverHIS002_0109520 [Cutaneotrichosporon cavernicola]|nr:hypothetical protein CcaverHIS002_0109520 [Cutaneotrichosporon cavernicola]